MRRLAPLALLLALFLLSGTAQAAYSGPVERFTVYDWNGTSAAKVARWEQAVVEQSVQLQRYWHTPAVAFAQQGGWPIYLVSWKLMKDTGDLGYHAQRGGQPYAAVSDLGGSIVFSHEIMEMLVDPLANRILTFWKLPVFLEICDPVENNSYSASNGVRISDAVTPQWYIPGSRGPYDLERLVTRPRQVQGYLGFL
jgi:hypothetical protein